MWLSAACIPKEDCYDSVTYARIFMIWMETPIIKEFRAYILLYKRCLDCIFMIWSGLSPELYQLEAKFELLNNPAIEIGNRAGMARHVCHAIGWTRRWRRY